MYNDIKSIQLKQLHNDVIGFEFFLLVKEMHKMGQISDEAYANAIASMYDTVTKQITGLNEELTHFKQAT